MHKIDKRKLRRKLIKDLVNKNWTYTQARKTILKIDKEEKKKFKFNKKVFDFLTKNNIYIIQLKFTNKDNISNHINFSLLTNENIDPSVNPDVVLCNKPGKNEIDLLNLNLNNIDLILSFNSLKFEEEKSDISDYMVKVYYIVFKYCMQLPEFKVFENLKKEYKKSL